MASEGATVPVERRLASITNLFQYREFGALLAVIVLIAVGGLVRSDVFFTSDNILGIVRNAAVVSIIAYGMTLLMVSGEFDLSVGSLMGVAGALVVTMYTDGYPFLLAVLLVLFGAAIYGIFQGLLVTKFGLPSLIVTIGTLTLLQGVLLVILGNMTQSIPSADYPQLLFYFGGVWEAGWIPVINQFPVQIVWVGIFLIAGWYILNRTPFGYRSQFTGGNPDSASRTGIDTDRVKIANFMIVAVLAAFAGISQVGFTQAVSPTTGQGIELIVIAAVVIGGTNLFGGEGSMLGALLGALVFALTENILVLAGLGTQLFEIFTGVFIIAAVFIEAASQRTRLSVVKQQYVDPVGSIVTSPVSFFKKVRTDVRGVEMPLTFLAINTLVLTALALVAVGVTSLMTGWEFSLAFVDAGPGMIGTMPVLMFGIVSGLTFLTAVFVHTVGNTLESIEDFDITLQAVMFSFAPAVLLFVPVVLAGFAFLLEVVFAAFVVASLPALYLLYRAAESLFGFSSQNALFTVAGTVVCWGIVGGFVIIQLLLT
ncbi:ABC transporter permease [Natronococcus sp. A-GB1]|uniref:ABC transporter permease n=1 Tax=Natronococcus sp. A-GB1 TaxID=3037648 RepID=UPI00241E4212|nr:ABC transporter permease [Natronococcus sp. A-GB1]MDG5761655.1 ABC transporter permease [Natronococcus sp. A-GB1]